MNRGLLILALGTALIGSFLLFQSCGRKAAECPLCEREIHQGMAVKITHNSHTMRTCCMACALTYKMQTKNVEIQSATDYLSGTAIDARNAFYVVGSDVSPCLQDPKVQKFLREPHSALHACYDRCDPGTSFLMELIVYPAIYAIWRWNFDLKPKLAMTKENGQ